MKKRFKSILGNIIEILHRPEMEILPGQLAYFFIMSLVPAITIISYFASFLSLSLDDVASYFNLNMSPTLVEMLTPVLENTKFRFGLIILFIICIYIVSNGMNSIIVAANNIYGIKQKSFLKSRIKSIIMVFIIVALFLFMLIVPVFGNFILRLIEKVTGYNKIYNIINVLRLPLSWLVIFIFIKTLYTIAPDKHIPSSHVNTGALFTSIGWIIITEIYLYYAGHFAHYSLYYSGLSNIVILMIWMYLLSLIFVIGLAINFKEEPYEIEKTRQLEKVKLTKKNHNNN